MRVLRGIAQHESEIILPVETTITLTLKFFERKNKFLKNVQNKLILINLSVT